QIGWVWGMVAFQALKLAVAFIMITAVLLMGRRPKEFFLTPGQLNAPVRVASTGGDRKKPSITWGGLGLILGICILPLTLLFFAIRNLPSAEVLVKALPFFPIAVLFAITNAFSEEMQYRAALLGDLQAAFGDDHGVWMTAVFFGLIHYFGGAPSGIPGVLIAGLLGALFAKCMLGSKGIAVSWFIHFCQNAVIYAFWAIGSVA
ncbi:MAG TPA: CPBP family intramembrane glutamic endopeptidase, partial [Anaerolineales bacterium]